MRVLIAGIFVFLLSATASADYRDVFEKEFIHKAWIGSAVIEEGVCVDCHTSKTMKEEYLSIPQEWKMSIHYENRVSCHNCHGGDPDDAAVSCGTPHSGFVGTPPYRRVPVLCGKCHIGIYQSYTKSGHGRALISSGKGPNCVTCHGSHRIQKANINIINKVRCSKCHTYERAKLMKQALFMTEKKIEEIEKNIRDLRAEGAMTAEVEKVLFRTQAEFRTLFHSIDVARVKSRADEFAAKLTDIEAMVDDIYSELAFRKNYSAFLFLLFACLSIGMLVLEKRYRD